MNNIGSADWKRSIAEFRPIDPPFLLIHGDWRTEHLRNVSHRQKITAHCTKGLRLSGFGDEADLNGCKTRRKFNYYATNVDKSLHLELAMFSSKIPY